MSDVTHVLNAIEQGDPKAAEQLLPLVYDELRKLAGQHMAREKPGQTLEATALVHEAYLRLVGAEGAAVPRDQHWHGRGHFFAAAAEAMRRILVENARRKQCPKHGGQRQRVELDESCAVADDGAGQVLLVNDALAKLAEESPEKAELVKLRYFAGMSIQEAANALGISRATADRYWSYAKAFLYCAIEDDQHS
jgi:RNA polymerase sigma factor (TIGR02999 family)